MSLDLAQAELNQTRRVLQQMTVERDLYQHVAAVLAKQALAGSAFATMDGHVVVKAEQIAAAKKSWKIVLDATSAKAEGSPEDASPEPILVLRVTEKPTNGSVLVAREIPK